MATVIMHHRVSDYTTWKAGYDGDKARRDAVGAVELAVGERADDPGMVYMIWQLADPSALQTLLSDPDLKAKMAELGVITAPEAIVLN